MDVRVRFGLAPGQNWGALECLLSQGKILVMTEGNEEGEALGSRFYSKQNDEHDRYQRRDEYSQQHEGEPAKQTRPDGFYRSFGTVGLRWQSGVEGGNTSAV